MQYKMNLTIFFHFTFSTSFVSSCVHVHFKEHTNSKYIWCQWFRASHGNLIVSIRRKRNGLFCYLSLQLYCLSTLKGKCVDGWGRAIRSIKDIFAPFKIQFNAIFHRDLYANFLFAHWKLLAFGLCAIRCLNEDMNGCAKPSTCVRKVGMT